jgi:hypothetical protein
LSLTNNEAILSDKKFSLKRFMGTFFPQDSPVYT